MKTTTASVPNIKDIRKILQEHKDELYQKFGVTHVGLFGSYAREEATPASDIDIVVEIENPDLFIMAALKTYLEELLKREVDVVRLRHHMNPSLKTRIEHEAVYV
ncbi:MAG: nucleotidyltransferase family protein [Candidatus Marinimicrobia bacterium]|nr:nucleotidyltransferase family protein [Candidatus Neomarinimicrobiota bacterium]MCF7828766.1 nucleotidyltransferase family protein [Candidatus Neomarinimicrobiota bacterium]MCF7880683.1 nucleotidyltransferase family protein [Candidatus Neomarinimicrobiota bacterium]